MGAWTRIVALACALVLQAACGAEAERASTVPPPLETPAPSGANGVGRADLVLGDDAQRVGLVAYYPIAQGASAPSAASQMSEPHIANLTSRFGADASWQLAAGRGYALADAPIAEGRWPVIVFAPGWRLAAHDYRALLEDLASRGFVVLAIAESPEAPSPPYAQTAAAINAVVGDARALAESGEGLGRGMDGARIAAMGHSVGGAAAALAASENETIGAVVNLDGDFGGESEHALVRRPILYLTGSDAREPERTHERRARTWARVSGNAPRSEALQASALRHLDFLDASLIRDAIPADRRENRFGDLPPHRGIVLASTLSAAFFDETLRARPGAFETALRVTPEVARAATVAVGG
ncbi:putative lipase [alpha proteobacterium U9-1i]|nr:putative lipase [alpha proteobacterium U9-1i]